MNSRKRLLAGLTILVCLATGALASTAIAAAPGWKPIAATGPTHIPPAQSEVQKLYVDAEGGTYTLSYEAQTTLPIAYNATASAVEAALDALPALTGNVQVGDGPGGPGAKTPYAIAFKGALTNTDVPQISTDSAGLTGGGSPNATVSTVVPGGAGTSKLALFAQNVGGAPSNGPVTYKVKLPPGVTTTGTPTGGDGFFATWVCTPGATSEFTCELQGPFGFFPPVPVEPGSTAPVLKATLTSTGAPGSGAVETEISGGGASGVRTFDLPLTVSGIPAPPGIQSFVAGAYTSNGMPDTRAGAHPYSASTGIMVNTRRSAFGHVIPSGEFRDIVVDLPPGFLGNPTAVPACPESIPSLECAVEFRDTVVGQLDPLLGNFGEKFFLTFPVTNTEAPRGYPAKFRFDIFVEPLNALGSLRSDEDYGVTVASLNTPQIATLQGTFFTFWGAPADPSHDAARGGAGGGTSSSPNTAFLTNSTNCSEQATSAPVTTLRATTWQNPGDVFTNSVVIPPVTGCEKLKFASDFTFEPSDTKSDSTASFRTSLTVPTEGLTDPSKLATPELKDIVVTLPEGVVLNASGADGLEACSLQQIGYRGNSFPMPNPIRFNREPQTCPDASKIGTGELKTPLIAEPLKGALYLAAQGEGNPYGSLFALYLVIEDPRHGIFIKLPGRVDPDEQTGQMKVTFSNLPQVPFSRLDLNLKGGARSALASPTTCGDFVTTATGTPWSAPESGPPTISANGFTINQGPNGMPCAPTKGDRPFDIGWTAGAEKTRASASGPFHMRITRADGSQELTGLELKTPPGVSASLKGVPRCSEAQIAQARNSTGKQEQQNSACPAGSKVGTLVTAAGSGPSPYYVSGDVYLAGPYKGAPVSVVAVTPAVAGPFDLGNVVVRSAVFIDRHTAQVFAKSDEIPQILKGVALRIRDVRIKLDRKDWTINPTSCEASAVELSAKGANGAVANRSARFQVGGCGALAFKPQLTAKVIGATKRNRYPGFEAKLTVPKTSEANIKDVQVTLPHSEFLEQAHIRTICTRVQAIAQNCPEASIYGTAEAESPLIDGKLTGPVFLKSSNNKLPDLAIFLKGPDSEPVEVEFQGRIDSINGQIRNTIEGLPDVPVSSFTLKMKGGKRGLLVNSRNLCKGKPGRLTVRMVGQNNKSLELRPRLGNSCKKQGKKKAKGKKRR